MRAVFAGSLLAGLLACAACAAAIPKAIFTDPAPDARSPARMVGLSIPSGGVSINGVAYLPGGPGSHPVLVICHGFPGTEKNLDLAQAVRRAGWVAVTFNYRGSWGSPGDFSFGGSRDDARAVVRYLMAPEQSARLHLDPKRIAIAGHSMGGWIAAATAASESTVLAAALISAPDLARLATMPHDEAVAFMTDSMTSLTGATPEGLANEQQAHAGDFSLISAAPGLRSKPLLVLTANDGLAADSMALAAAVRELGGTRVVVAHVATDHAWSDHRIDLQARILTWLATLH